MQISEKLSAFSRTIRFRKAKGIFNQVKYASSLILKPTIVNHEPLFAHIEPTVECNLECGFCINPKVKRNQQQMSLEQYKDSIDKFNYLVRVVLTGAGEPLCHPDITLMIEYNKKKGIFTTLTTNATLLNAELSENLISRGLDSIDFSLDGAKKETYQTLRKADFELVLSNIRTFHDLKNRVRNPIKTAINFLAQEKNIEELPLMPELVSSLGIDEIKILIQHGWGNDLAKKSFLKSKKQAFLQLKKLLPAVKKEAKKRKIKLSFLSPCVSDYGKCLWPWRSCYITCDGYVTFCCVLASDPEKYFFGNIFSSNISEIWNSQRIIYLRKQVKKEKTCSFI
jgi:MoaA/NifB/PqqE/SkfB family radical SAM enzyme